MPGNQRKSIAMSADELATFLSAQRTAIMCSHRSNGQIHAVPLWYAVLASGELAFSTKAKSQKVANLRADPEVTVLVEDGASYYELQGAEMRGQIRLVNAEDGLVDIVDRMALKYGGATRTDLSQADRLHNRIGLVLEVASVASWDHSKLSQS